MDTLLYANPFPYISVFMYTIILIFDRNFQEESKMKPVEFPC